MIGFAQRAIFWTHFQLDFWESERVDSWHMADKAWLSQSLAISLRPLAGPHLPLRAWNELDQDKHSNASNDLHWITGDDDASSQPQVAARPSESLPPSHFVLLLIIASDPTHSIWSSKDAP